MPREEFDMTPSDHQKPDEWETVQQMFQADENSPAEPFRSLLQNFRRDLSQHPYVRRQTQPQTSRSHLGWLWSGRVLAPATAVAALVLVISLFGRPALTWGQVAARFQEMSFFSASIYSKENGLSKPEHIELWMGQGGKARVRLGQQLIFAERGEILAAFDLRTRKQTDPNEMAVGIIEMLGRSETFSMATVLRSLTRGGPVNQTPVLNENAMIAEDLAVFDLESEDHSVWFRIWALKSSGLPVRMRMWNPRNAESLEVVFDYSKPQPERFFDPKAFASILGTVRTDQLNLAYLYLQDPGGRPFVPGITDQTKAMELIMSTVNGESFSMAHYADKALLLYFWGRDFHQRDWDWLDTLQEKYSTGGALKIVTVALDKKSDRVKKCIASRGIDFPVLHERGKGMSNPLARALGVKRPPECWLIRTGKAYRILRGAHDEMLDLVCNGLSYRLYAWISRFATYSETTREQMRDLCGEPHETETVGGKELWTYRFSSPNGERKQVVTIRFNEEGRYSGMAMSSRLVNPSHVAIKLSKDFWESQIVPGLGRENMPESNPHHHVEIQFKQGRGGPVIGGGNPITEIEPETLYDRELASGGYSISVRLMDHNNKRYNQVKEMEIFPEVIVGKNESVSLHFKDANEPTTTRSQYRVVERNMAAENRQRMLKKPDWKARFKAAKQEERNYDDPKYLPWQLHLKEIAARYELSPLPKRMELIPKDTGETYALTMFPKNLPGHEGYSAASLEGDLKEQFRYQILGAGVTRWPDDTPSTELCHDLVYRDDVSQPEQYRFILQELEYRIERVIENRDVFVASYDGRALPDPEIVSTPNPVGGGYYTAGILIDLLTRARNCDFLAQGPVFVDETGLPSKPGPQQTFEDIAICMEMPNTDQSFEALRPWFKENFGITFTQETRALEVFVIKKM
jgi:hypothetical protein